MESKYCPRCEETKPLTEYYGGTRRAHCKDCERKDARKRMRRPDNKMRTAYHDAKKQATKYGVYDDLTLEDVRYTFAIADGYCNYCGDHHGRDLQLEHIFAMSTGGHNTLSNITTACQSCNLHKRDEAILTHIQTNKFDIDLLNALIDRIAYRRDVNRIEVIELLELQQSDVFNKQAQEMMERIKTGDD